MKKIIFILVLFLFLLGGCGNYKLEKQDTLKQINQVNYFACPNSKAIVTNPSYCPIINVQGGNKVIENVSRDLDKISLDNKTINEEEKSDNKDVNEKEAGEEEKECAYVGSKNSDVYHELGCVWAKKIKEENLVCFSSKEEAESKGYRPCKACKNM